MNRHTLLGMLCAGLIVTGDVRADALDRYTNTVLVTVLAAGDSSKEIDRLTTDMIAQHDRVLPGTVGALLIVRTNEGRLSKCLVQTARQKVDATRSVPILLVDRYVAFKPGEERTVVATGQNLSLFGGLHFSLDLGQVVPAELGGDVRLKVDGSSATLEPVGKAKLYIVTKPLPASTSAKPKLPMPGDPFEISFIAGRYRLHDDGRRSGMLKLQVDDKGEITGGYYSDKNGQKYEVTGKIGTPKHSIEFTIHFPKAEQVFRGLVFTGDARALVGSSRLQERETGFYAVRVDDE